MWEPMRKKRATLSGEWENLDPTRTPTDHEKKTNPALFEDCNTRNTFQAMTTWTRNPNKIKKTYAAINTSHTRPRHDTNVDPESVESVGCERATLFPAADWRKASGSAPSHPPPPCSFGRGPTAPPTCGRRRRGRNGLGPLSRWAGQWFVTPGTGRVVLGRRCTARRRCCCFFSSQHAFCVRLFFVLVSVSFWATHTLCPSWTELEAPFLGLVPVTHRGTLDWLCFSFWWGVAPPLELANP